MSDRNTLTEVQLKAELGVREPIESKFEKEYPDGFDRDSDMIEAMKRMGLYCGACRHGNGCEHGVPASRY